MGTDEKSNLLQKISGLRQEIMTKDWSDDKMFTMGGKGGYSYLSADKVKKTLAPLFAKHGLELRMEFEELQHREPIGNMSQHWTVKLFVTMVDVETGDQITSSVYGEAGDSGDKGVSKAQTCAIKQWVFSEFFIADGIDPDAAYDGMVNTTGFYKKSTEEKEEVVSKVLAQSMKPAKAEKPVEEAKPAKPAKAAPKKAAEPKKEEKPAEEPAKPTEEAPAKTEAKSDKSYKPTGPQAKAIKRIEEVWEQRAKAGEVTPEEYNAMSMARASMSCPADAVAFIKTYKVG